MVMMLLAGMLMKLVYSRLILNIVGDFLMGYLHRKLYKITTYLCILKIRIGLCCCVVQTALVCDGYVARNMMSIRQRYGGGEMSWRRTGKSLQCVTAQTLLLCFTVMLVLKLDHAVSYSWWVTFFPLWLFHVVVARGRFSLPFPLVPYVRHWSPCHAVVAMPLLVVFELLLCIYLESIWVYSSAAVNLKIVFLPLLALEVIILGDNFRLCSKALLPGDNESLSGLTIWEILPHFWVGISMLFFLAATVFTLRKLSGDGGALGWWDLFINYGIAECFAFLVCTKWSNPVIHRDARTRGGSSSSFAIRYLDWTSGLVVSSEDYAQDRMCGLQDIGGHIMKISIIGFQILLCMKLEGTPPSARNIPLPVLFSPVFVLQVGILLATSGMVGKIVLLLRSEAAWEAYFVCSSRVRDCFDLCSSRVCECFGFLHHRSRLLGWWSIDETSREEQARLFHDGAAGYNTFSGYPPEMVKKMPKKDLAEEVLRLQAALGERTEIMKSGQQEYERLQQEYDRLHEKTLCRVCYEGEISIVLLPCRHRILCSLCGDKCKKCPICRVSIEVLFSVYDV